MTARSPLRRGLSLLAQIRAAEESGGAFEMATVAGRRIVRIHTADGVSMSSVTDAEQSILEGLLSDGPPTIAHAGLPMLTLERDAFTLAGVEGGVTVCVSFDREFQVGESSADHPFDERAERWRRLTETSEALKLDAATRLLASNPTTWDGCRVPSELARSLVLQSASLSQGQTTLYYAAGERFFGHFIEVFMDADHEIQTVSVAG